MLHTLSCIYFQFAFNLENLADLVAGDVKVSKTISALMVPSQKSLCHNIRNGFETAQYVNTHPFMQVSEVSFISVLRRYHGGV